MKLHKGLAVYLVRDRIVVQELEALAKVDKLHLVRLNDKLIATTPESGKRLSEILKKRGYFPRSIHSFDSLDK